MDYEFLKVLNPAQLKAVQHPPDVPLQILAGPGSGKTKVLTSRIAYLILHHEFPPSSICAVTFTNKAANEMRERLTKIIGKEKTTEVRMGTFHALCALFLRKHSKSIGMDGNFTVGDTDESKRIVARLLTPYKEVLQAKKIDLDQGAVSSRISKAKAKGYSPEDIMPKRIMETETKNGSTIVVGATQQEEIDTIVSKIYTEYENHLRRNNCLDFDDLLVFGVRLFTSNPRAAQWCRHVLVDEFQDTNTVQYSLMRSIAASSGCVTIVGDPDQSIYGWRSAEIENLSRMQMDFPSTEQIMLEQNYRSTGSILSASIAIVSQDKSRIPKTLLESHPTGPCPVLCSFSSEHEEVTFIAMEIKRLMANMGGVLNWGDFAILLRFNSLSRAVEQALQIEKIPNRVLAGQKFFDRMEVKDILAYLQMIDNPQFLQAFSRAANVPSRGIGEKTLAEILARAEITKVSPLTAVERIYDSDAPDIKPAVKHRVESFVKVTRELRTLANSGASPVQLILRLVTLLGYKDHLRRTQPDWESRWDNVQELINFASEMQTETNIVSPPKAEPSGEDGPAKEDGMEEKITPLSLFLQGLSLSSEGDNDNEDRVKEKVTIATCHAAKGLEWPVVIIPAVEEGHFPSFRNQDIEEERRLLYVACTRAQGLLYVTHSTKRKTGGKPKDKDLSKFISVVVKENPMMFATRVTDFTPADRAVVAQVVGRPEPQRAEVHRRIAEFKRTTRKRQDLNTSKANGSQDGVRAPTWPPSRNGSSNMGASFSASSMLPEVQNILSLGAVIRSTPSMTGKTATPVFTSAILPNSQNRPPMHGSQQFASTAVTPVGGGTNPSMYLAPTQTAPARGSSSSTQLKEEGRPAGSTKRLGMGRKTGGYPNKKFKPRR